MKNLVEASCEEKILVNEWLLAFQLSSQEDSLTALFLR